MGARQSMQVVVLQESSASNAQEHSCQYLNHGRLPDVHAGIGSQETGNRPVCAKVFTPSSSSGTSPEDLQILIAQQEEHDKQNEYEDPNTKTNIVQQGGIQVVITHDGPRAYCSTQPQSMHAPSSQQDVNASDPSQDAHDGAAQEGAADDSRSTWRQVDGNVCCTTRGHGTGEAASLLGAASPPAAQQVLTATAAREQHKDLPEMSTPLIRCDGPFAPYQTGLTSEQAPTYMQYRNVLGGYRAGGDHGACLRSLFEWHTETINAWTMLLGSLFSICATAAVCLSDHLVQPQYRVVFVVFMLSALLHLPFSVGYHLFMPISRDVFAHWRKLDVCAIFSVSVPLTFSLAFFTLPWWGALASTATTAVVAAVAVRSFWFTGDHFQLDHAKHTVFVGSIVCCWSFPMAVALVHDVLSLKLSVVGGMALAAYVSLGLGGVAFAVGIPECWAPGRFDIVGHSHQLMHVGVIAANVFEFFFVYYSYQRYVSNR